ncbi:hypothetical protein KAX97_11940 [candidate division WOR-3 bacterium]|nr:hypothetical protein [candidate division WOR-3 bacterium]
MGKKKTSKPLSREIVAIAKRANRKMQKVNKECAELIDLCLSGKEIPTQAIRCINQVNRLNCKHTSILKELSLA